MYIKLYNMRPVHGWVIDPIIHTHLSHNGRLRMAASTRKMTEAGTRFLEKIGDDDADIDAIANAWDEIPSKNRNAVRRRIPGALVSGNLEPYDFLLRLRSFQPRMLNAMFPTEMRRQVTRQFIQREPNATGIYEVATWIWGKGNIPVDILLVLIKRDRFIDEIRNDEIHDENREELSMEIAKRGDFASLQRVYPKDIPEPYVRACLAAMERKRNGDHSFDILHCSILLKEWIYVDNALRIDFEQRLTKRDADIVMLLRGQPRKVLAIAAEWLANRGKLELLKTLYGKDKAPWGTPPKTFLKACLQANKERLANGEPYERDAAECSVLLKDWKETRQLLGMCTHEWPLSYLLLHLYQNGQSIPKKKRS